MPLTWSEAIVKAQTIAGDDTATTLVQLKQDMNIGQQRFNAALGRYFSRKQQFTDLVDGQSIYQTPIDSIRVIGMTVMVSDTYATPVKEIRSEFEWRQLTAYPYDSNWPAFYFVLGSDEVQLWPTPSQDVTNGLRFYYQQQDFDLSVEDIISSALSPVQTCTATNGDVTITSTGSTFTSQLKGLWFQTTGTTDLTWYQIVDVPTSSTLTLKSAFVGTGGAGLSFRIGQTFIFPQEYSDVPIDYALGRYFQSRNNPERAKQYYNESDTSPGSYNAAVRDAVEKYSSSTTGNVITDDLNYISAWYLTPTPGA